MVHGDLKGVGELRKMCFTTSLIRYVQCNILINDDKNAVLSGFGLGSITAEVESLHDYPVCLTKDARWMAPELMSIFDEYPEPIALRLTKESDMYSLALVVLEVRSSPRQLTLNLTEARTSGLDFHRTCTVLGHSRCRSDTPVETTEAPEEA